MKTEPIGITEILAALLRRNQPAPVAINYSHVNARLRDEAIVKKIRSQLKLGGLLRVYLDGK